ncbi:MAG: CHASE2 domain-containing protein [bacterium]
MPFFSNLRKEIRRLFAGLGVGFAAFAALWILWAFNLFDLAELKSLDHRFVRFAQTDKANRDIAVIAIDEASLDHFENQLGRWPWPRTIHGYIVDFLKMGGAKSIAFDVLFLEPDKASDEDDDNFAGALKKAGNVTLAMLFNRDSRTRQSPEPPEIRNWREGSAIPIEGKVRVPAEAYSGANLPIPKLLSSADDIGYINLQADPDGPSRRLKPLVHYQGRYYASFPLTIAMKVLGARKVGFTRASELELSGRKIPLNARGEMLLKWHGPSERIYPIYPIAKLLSSFKQIHDGKKPDLDPKEFKDKIVFIAGTAAGTYDLRVTPYSFKTPGVFIHIAALDNMLAGDFLRQTPDWVTLATLAALCLLTAATLVAFSSFKAKISLILAYAAGYYGISVWSFTAAGRWVELVTPEIGIFATFLSASLVEYFTEGKRKRQIKNVFQHFMMPSVVEKLLENPEEVKLGGEKKELTVFFSDLEGFASISEGLEPERLVALLNRYLTAMTDIILEHQGFLDKYEGDAIMAVFGTPLDQPKHATLACYAALENQERLESLREELKADGYPEIRCRIGLNSGPMVVGNMGSENRMDYTVMGDAVNLGSRLEGASKQYGTHILIGENTFSLATNDIEVREIDLIRVKGIRQPVRVYELLGKKGELPPEKVRLVGVYVKGLAQYRERNWRDAIRCFQEALEINAQDGPARVYVERCETFIENPPPLDWDGVYEMKTK